MRSSVGIPADTTVLPFFVDAGPAPNPGGLPVGGVTIIDLPNSHLQYAITWYGLAAALLAIVAVRLWRARPAMRMRLRPEAREAADISLQGRCQRLCQTAIPSVSRPRRGPSCTSSGR